MNIFIQKLFCLNVSEIILKCLELRVAVGEKAAVLKKWKQ